MERKIEWSKTATEQLRLAFFTILEQSKSIETAGRVISEIRNALIVLETQPEIFKRDELKFRNQGDIRVFEKHSYRISYQIKKRKIYILRVRYARKKPLGF